MKIVVDREIPYLDTFFAQCELSLLPGRFITQSKLKDAEGLIIRSVTNVNEELLKNTPIKWVASLTAGTDHIDVNYLKSQGILWHHAKGFNAPPVADYVMSTIAAVMNTHDCFTTKKAAVVGVGEVGRLVVEKLRILGFDVLEVDPIRSDNEVTFSKITLEEIKEVDLICLHTPLTKTGKYPTYHMIDGSFLEKQNPQCVIINAARGAIAATQDILNYAKKFVFCLDVFEHEPNINWQLLNKAFIATPHIAGHTIESKLRGVRDIYQWLNQQGLIAHSTNELAIPPHDVFIPKQCHSWHAVIQYVFDILKITQDMAIMPSDIGKRFDNIRKRYGNRHEFSNIVLSNTTHLTENDKSTLKKLGFLIHH